MSIRKVLGAASDATTTPTANTVETQLHDVESHHLKTTVPVSVILPVDRDAALLPLLISLDGGVGDRMSLVRRAPIYADLFGAGVMPPMIVVSFSGGASQFYHGAWEEWVADELPAWAASTFGARTDPDNVLLTGMSVGGYGTLKIGFKRPSSFRAIAALEPVIMPTLEWPEQHTRASWWMLTASAEAIWGSPFDPARFLADHPPNLAAANAARIVESGLHVYLECGDEDLLNLQDGAEFLHRILWDNAVPHEFHQVRWADHGGASVDDRLIEAHAFLAAAWAGGKSERRDLPLTTAEQAFVDFVLSGAAVRGEAPPARDEHGDPAREVSVMARLWQPLRDLAVARDPEMERIYGRMPKPD